MPTRYDQELNLIERDVLTMGSHAGEMVRLAVRATMERDVVLANHVVAMDDELDRQELAATEHIVTTILREAPVAHDLLFLTSMLGIISDIEKVGDDATKIARRVSKLGGEFPTDLRRALSEIDRKARENLGTAIRLCCEFNSDQASALVLADDTVDLAYKGSRRTVMELMKTNPENLRQLVRTNDLFRAIEHVSDRAVDIAKRLQRFHERFPGHQ